MAKPASGTLVDTGHALYTNLAAAWGLLEGSGTSSADATGNGHTLTLASSGYWTTVGGEPVLAIGSANAAPAAVTSPPVMSSTVAWSFAWRAKQTSSGNAGMIAGNTANTSEFVWMNGTQITWRNSTPNDKAWTGRTPTTIHNYLLTSTGTANPDLSLYQDGVLVSTQTQGFSSGSGWTINALGNGYTGTTLSLIGQLDYAFLWSGRTLNGTDASNLNANPWAMYVATPGSFAIAPTAVPANHSGNITLALTGSGTSWDGTTVFTPSGVANVTKVSQNVTSATAATVVVTTGAGTGTLTITESVTGTATATTTVGTASFTRSPTSGDTGVTQTVSAVGTNTVWTQETAATLFSLSGGTGASLGSIVVTDDTHASFSLVNGSAAGTLTITANPTGATQTFTVNAASSTLVVTTPADHKTHQRSGTTGSIPISGTYTGGPTSKAIEASFNDGAYAPVATGSGGTFSGTLSGQAQGQGTLTVRFVDETAISDTAASVGIGDVFVLAGQSNASGRGTNNQAYRHPTLKATRYTTAGGWSEAVDPITTDDSGEAGSVWPLVATPALAVLGVPVAFVACAIGGTSITTWVPGQSNYVAMTAKVTAAAPGGIRAVLWWQGETDGIAAMSQATYNGHLDTLANAINAAYSCKLIAARLQNSSAIANGDEDAIRAAVDEAVADNSNVRAGPDLSDLGSDDSYHLQSDAKLATAAARWWAAIDAAVYADGGSLPLLGGGLVR